MTRKIVLLLISVLSLYACKDKNEYRVDSEFTSYVNNFVNEGEKSGHKFNFNTEGLIIEFADLKDETAGLCHYEDPIRIEIDKDYWESLKDWEGAEIMRENVIFHEMGHGILGRRHINTILNNGDWKSMMCGGEKVNNRPWNINYRGERRTYYIDELFDESATSPTIMNSVLSADTTGFTPKYQFNFDNDSNSPWKNTTTKQHSIKIENGKLLFTSFIAKSYIVMINSGLNVQSDFCYELTIDNKTENDEGQVGILFGSTTSTDSIVQKAPLEYFHITNNKKMYMGNRLWYSFFTELENTFILSNQPNSLKIFKINGIIYYFINNTFVYSSEMEPKTNGNSFGFSVPANGTVTIDNLKIGNKQSMKTKAIFTTNETLTTICLPAQELKYQQYKK